MTEKKAFPSDSQDKFMLRFPEGMRDEVKKAAEKNGRSMNAEIIHRLTESFEKESATVVRPVLFRGEEGGDILFSRSAPEQDDQLSPEEAETVIQQFVRVVKKMTKKGVE